MAAKRGIFDESRPLWRVMALFLVPLMLSNLLQSASGTISSIFIGRLIGVDGLAAISAFFPILFFLVAFLIGVSIGSTVLIGQAYGARDEQRLKQVAGTTVTLSLISGVLAAGAGALFVEPVLVALGTPSNILAQSAEYARIVFFGLPLIYVFISYMSFLRGVGDSTTPFYFLLLTAVIGTAVTPALIRGWFGLPQLGVASAGYAFVVSNGVGLAAMLIYLGVARHPLGLDASTLHNLKIRWPVLVQIVRIGIPSGIQLVLVSLSEVAVVSFVNRFGSEATAAYGAVNQIVSYVQFPAISVGIASSVFGAQSIGAARSDLLQRVVHAGVGLNYTIGVALIGLCYLFARQLAGLFLTSAHTLDIAVQLLMITLWSYLLLGNASVLSGIMRSSGTVFWPTTIGIFAIWGVEVPTAYFLSHRIGLQGIWFGYPAAFVAALALQSTYFFLVWKRMRHARLV